MKKLLYYPLSDGKLRIQKVRYMKRVLPMLLTLLGVVGLLPAAAQMTPEKHLADYDFAVRQVEESYAGYPSSVTAANRAQYESLKERLRSEVLEGRNGYEAAGELFGWFGDFHLRAGSFTEPYQRTCADYGSMTYAPGWLACRVDERTYLIRVPSFEYDQTITEWIDSAVESYKRSGCEYLVVDIRGNGGGSDQVYGALLELLYDRPAAAVGVEIRVSSDNERFLRRAIRERDGLDYLLPVADSMAAGMRDFLSCSTEVDLIAFDSVSVLPRRAGVLIDGRVASSAEQFVLDVRACSGRTNVYGRDHTLGCLDFSNIRRADLPYSGISCWIPTTRSCRVEAGCGIDRDGIVPDVRIPLPLPDSLTTNVDAWVVWVADKLKTENPNK